ncbi:hypothetical protein [Nostoc sp.]
MTNLTQEEIRLAEALTHKAHWRTWRSSLSDRFNITSSKSDSLSP